MHEWKKHHCDSCDYQAMTRGNLKIHQQSVHEGKNIHVSHLTTRAQSVHEGKKYPCCSRDYQATERRSLKTHQFMTARNTHVAHVIIKAYRKETWKLISNQCMKGRNNIVHEGKKYPLGLFVYQGTTIENLQSVHKKKLDNTTKETLRTSTYTF